MSPMVNGREVSQELADFGEHVAAVLDVYSQAIPVIARQDRLDESLYDVMALAVETYKAAPMLMDAFMEFMDEGDEALVEKRMRVVQGILLPSSDQMHQSSPQELDPMIHTILGKLGYKAIRIEETPLREE